MKRLWIIPLIVLLLAGCGKQESLETVSDIQDTPVVAPVQRVQLQLPPELSSPALQSEQTGTLYLCDEYALTVQTMESGDLKETVRIATGMDRDTLQILQTRQGEAKRYQFVWTANGENGIQVGRCCILDDGTYHYVLTALADEADAGEVQQVWKEIFTSFRLATEQEQVSTGS